MNNLSITTQDTLTRYFEILKHGGYLQKHEVDKVLILSFIEEIIDDKFFDYITDSDYNIMINSIYRMIPNSCTIKFPSYDVYTNLINEIRTCSKYRATEDLNLRITEKNTVRMTV